MTTKINLTSDNPIQFTTPVDSNKEVVYRSVQLLKQSTKEGSKIAPLAYKTMINDAETQYQLGNWYYADGKQDIALEWYSKAFAQGHVKATHTMGLELLKKTKETDNVEQQYTLRRMGLEALKKSSTAGNKDSALLLCSIYHTGAFGITVDHSKAQYYHHIAQGN